MKNKYIEIASNKLSGLKNIFKSFSVTEKAIFSLLLVALIISILGIIIQLNKEVSVERPTHGGTLTEGIIGTPRFINPVIANSNADKDLSAIIYSGLTKVNLEGEGEITLDLAERFDVSEDGLIYDFYLHPDAKFHDDEIVTADDVIFTILKVQDPEIRSPHIAEWEGVAIEKVSDRQIRFVLDQPDPLFLQKASIGILPKHLWQEITSDEFSLSLYNIEPVGSGPFEISKIDRNTIDIPQAYILKPNKDYILGRPFINKLIFKFAKNEDELVQMFKSKEIDSINSISSEQISDLNLKNNNLITFDLPRIFSLFINQVESPALSFNSTREALRLATPKEKIVEEIFSGYANRIDGPIPNFNENESEFDLEKAEQILIEVGWEKNDNGIYEVEIDNERFVLSTSISTNNIPELVKVAEMVAEEWRKIGAEVEVKIFNTSDLNQNVIRPRNFEVLLFGNVIENYSDLYAFWHSSRRNDPGLNITAYANIETDAILENFLNKSNNQIDQENLNSFINDIKEDIPAIFIYSPKFVYVLPSDIRGVIIDKVSEPKDRLVNIHQWFIKTNRIWKIFD